MRRMVAGLMLGVLGAGMAHATATDGVVLTNFASATYQVGGVAFSISYGATCPVRVATPRVVIGKTASPSLQGAGGFVTFCLSFSNTSNWASAQNVTIRDQLPDSMTFGLGLVENDPRGGVLTTEFSTNGGTSWNAGWPPAGQAGGSLVLLRWGVDILGLRKSAMVCYTVRIQ